MLDIVQFSDYVSEQINISLVGAERLDIHNCSGDIFITGGDILYLDVQLSCLSAFNMEPIIWCELWL